MSNSILQTGMGDGVFNIMLLVVVILIIIIFIVKNVMGYMSDKKAKDNLRFPPFPSKCPDYWSSLGDSRCKNDNQSFWDLNFVQPTFDSDGKIVYDPSWIKKHISKATKRHLTNVEQKIEIRVLADSKGKRTGTGTKEQAKTLWNKLVALAELEIDGHAFPTFPKFSIDKTPQCSHLRAEQWDAVLEYIHSASNGACSKSLTEEEYYNLPHKFQNVTSTRNWVDFYDALMVQFYFSIRPQDMKRIKPQMFSVVEGDEDKVIFRIKGKTGLEKKTENYRNGATEVVSEILKRKGNVEYLVFPNVDRSTQQSGVDVKLNALLKHAIDEVCPEYRGDVDWTMVKQLRDI